MIAVGSNRLEAFICRLVTQHDAASRQRQEQVSGRRKFNTTDTCLSTPYHGLPRCQHWTRERLPAPSRRLEEAGCKFSLLPFFTCVFSCLHLPQHHHKTACSSPLRHLYLAYITTAGRSFKSPTASPLGHPQHPLPPVLVLPTPPPHPRRPAPPPHPLATHMDEAYLHLTLPAETVGRAVVRHYVLKFHWVYPEKGSEGPLAGGDARVRTERRATGE